MNVVKPQIGQTCPALKNENYDYHLSGDCTSYCICVLNNKRCLGVTVVDPDNKSSQFFSRGCNRIDFDLIKRCPTYGASKETIKTILKEKAQDTIDNL